MEILGVKLGVPTPCSPPTVPPLLSPVTGVREVPKFVDVEPVGAGGEPGHGPVHQAPTRGELQEPDQALDPPGTPQSRHCRPPGGSWGGNVRVWHSQNTPGTKNNLRMPQN